MPSGILSASRGFPLPQLRVSDPLVFEGNHDTTNLVFQVELIGGSNDVVSVDFSTVDHSASGGSDYSSTNGTLVFQPGESNKTVAVTVSSDTTPENDEVVLLILSNPANAIILSHGVRTIYSDDCATSVALAFYPGVTINGCAGKPYEIQVAFDSNPNQWTTVTNLVLPSTPYLWVDTIRPSPEIAITAPSSCRLSISAREFPSSSPWTGL